MSQHTQQQANRGITLASDHKTFRDLMMSPGVQEKLVASAAKGLDLDRLRELAISTVTRSPDLQKCTAASIVSGLIKAAQFGLELGGPAAEAYLVPFYNSTVGATEALMIPGYRGLIKLVLQSGEVESITAQVVYRGEECGIELGDNPSIRHIPSLTTERIDANIIAAYMVARMKNGRNVVELMTRKDIERIRASSKAKNAMAWTDWWGEMARKSVVRRGLKYLPMQTNAKMLIEEEDSQLSSTSDDLDSAIPVRGLAAVTQKLAAKQLANNATQEPAFDAETGEEIPSDFVDAESVPQQEPQQTQQPAPQQEKQSEAPKPTAPKRPIVVSAEQTESALVDASIVANLPESDMRARVAAWCQANGAKDFYKDTIPAQRVKVVEAIRDGRLGADGVIK